MIIKLTVNLNNINFIIIHDQIFTRQGLLPPFPLASSAHSIFDVMSPTQKRCWHSELVITCNGDGDGDDQEESIWNNSGWEEALQFPLLFKMPSPP